MSATPPRLFGTDGIRGPFGEPPLDRKTVERLGLCMGAALRATAVGSDAPASGEDRPRVIIGGDTRDSTPALATWLASGLAGSGAECMYAGVLPTPGIAVLTRRLGLAGGIVISASHNPHPDNGIKLFDGEGFKWRRDAERRLEEAIHATSTRPPETTLSVDYGLAETYIQHLESSLEADALQGLTIALDCANGAASPYAQRLFEDFGARVHMLGNRPNGENINLDCGSTRPEALIDLVRRTGADLGVALDGDADRVVLVDEAGGLQDGDSLLYLWASELKRTGRLTPAAIVATTMSNLGLEHALRVLGIELIRCDVGDRVVVETMREHGLVLGGEQSGHIIHLGLGSTGDGLLTALQISALVHRTGQPLSRLAAPVERFPQILLNVRVARKPDFDTVPSVQARAAEVESELGDSGRLLLRYSGTEPLARVMIEGRDRVVIEALARELADEIETAIGSGT